MTSTAAVSPAGTRAEIIGLQILVVVLLGMRLWTQLNAGILGDEAYYWMWGQHPDLSYFDHPPLNAWLLGLVSLVSWHPFAVRVLTWASLAIVLLIFRSWSRRLAPEAPQTWFWRAAAVYVSSPFFFVLTTSVYPDHLLVALSLAAVHCFAVFAERTEAEAPAARRWLFAASALLGLAVLTKYNAVFVGIGFAVTFLVRPKLRPLLLTPAPWLAAAFAVGLQAPVIWWNLIEGGVSYRFHFQGRWLMEPGLHWVNLARFVGFNIAVWSPFLIWPLIRFIRGQATGRFAAAARSVALWTFAASTLVFLIMSIVLDAFFHWNIVALVAITPLLVSFANKWLRLLHYIYGLLVACVLVIHFTVLPEAYWRGDRDYGTALTYDWHVVVQHMQTQASERPGVLIAATRYSTTSQLGLALGTTDVVKLSPEFSQWDFWQAGRDFTGQSALILIDEEPNSSAHVQFLQEHFETLTVVDSFEIERLGRRVYTWRIMLGENWTP